MEAAVLDIPPEPAIDLLVLLRQQVLHVDDDTQIPAKPISGLRSRNSQEAEAARRDIVGLVARQNSRKKHSVSTDNPGALSTRTMSYL